MLALDKKKISTKLIGFWEDAGGQLWLDMKRGEEEKKFVWPGYREDIYTKELDWCQSEYGWTEEEFEQYWNDNREDSEIWCNIYECVDVYDDEEMWEKLGKNF